MASYEDGDHIGTVDTSESSPSVMVVGEHSRRARPRDRSSSSNVINCETFTFNRSEVAVEVGSSDRRVFEDVPASTPRRRIKKTANRKLRSIPEFESPPSTLSETLLDRLHGELHFNENYCPTRVARDHERASNPPRGRYAMSPYIMKAGISLPLHPFFVEVLDALNIAPLQLSPNAWRCMVGILLFYTKCGLGTPSLQEFFYMFTLRPDPNHDDFFYLAPWAKHRGLPITNNISNAGDYKTRYFFVKDRQVNEVFISQVSFVVHIFPRISNSLFCVFH